MLVSFIGGSVGGLHKSMTRLSSSQQINQNGSNSTNVNNASSGNIMLPSGGVLPLSVINGPSSNYVTPVPPLSSNVIITGHNKWGIPATKITSGGVTVTTAPAPPRIRPQSQGPTTLMGSTGALGKLSGSILNQSSGSIGIQQQPQQPPQSPTSGIIPPQNNISVHHASPASPTAVINNKKSVTTPSTNVRRYAHM